MTHYDVTYQKTTHLPAACDNKILELLSAQMFLVKYHDSLGNKDSQSLKGGVANVSDL